MADNKKEKPVGSGWFCIICGLGSFMGFFFVHVSQFSPDRILQVWFIFVAVVLLWWGFVRVTNKKFENLQIGQETINSVIGIMAATFALLTLLHDAQNDSRKNTNPAAAQDQHSPNQISN